MPSDDHPVHRPVHRQVENLSDIIENAERIGRYVGGMDRDAFAANGQARDAVERCLERISEAGRRLGDDAPALLPGHPWPDIRGMGNHLRHAYDRINVDVIWLTVQRDVPRLAADARSALARLTGAPDQPG